MTSYAVVGASRGIGLEFVRQLAGRPNSTVFAVVRNPAKSTYLTDAISGLKNVRIVAGDVADYASLQRAAHEISAITGGKLDVLIHNAARMDVDKILQGFDDFPSMDALDADFIDAFKVNALGVVHSFAAFVPLLRASTANLKKVVVVGTRAADPSTVRTFGLSTTAAYGITKAAGLIATTKWAVKLKDEGFVVVTVCPGLVDVAGTTPAETLENPAGKTAVDAVASFADAAQQGGLQYKTPTQAVEELLKIADELKPSDNGLALSADGQWST